MPPQVIIGIAIIDIFTGRTSLNQFSTDCLNSHTSYDELERYISAYRPSECLLATNLPEKMADDIINFVGLENTKLHKLSLDSAEVERAMKQNYQQETFKRFFPHLDSSSAFTEYYIAAQSFCYLLNFVYRHNPNLVSKLAEPIFEHHSARLILANHSLKRLAPYG
jgi:DNA mismatch repair ATPase MutS